MILQRAAMLATHRWWWYPLMGGAMLVTILWASPTH